MKLPSAWQRNKPSHVRQHNVLRQSDWKPSVLLQNALKPSARKLNV